MARLNEFGNWFKGNPITWHEIKIAVEWMLCYRRGEVKPSVISACIFTCMLLDKDSDGNVI